MSGNSPLRRAAIARGSRPAIWEPLQGDRPALRQGPAIRRATVLAGLLVTLVLAAPPLAAAHGPAPAQPPDIAILAFGWSFEPLVALPLLAAALVWLRLVARVNRVHAASRVPRRRSLAFLGGLAAIALALQSGIERYDTTLFSLHMVQHLLLAMVAPPLLALGAPVTLLLRAAGAEDRRRWILPVLHSRLARIVTHPLVAAIVFAAVMWGIHFSPLFNHALEDRLAHDLEHLLFLVAGLLFWWHAVGLDPAPYRLSPPVRILYTFLQMPQNTFLAVAILFAPAPLYPHYASLDAAWLPDALADQQLAAGIMWIAGDLLFLVAILAIVLDWSRREERETVAQERRSDLARSRIRAREAALAARRAGAGAVPPDPPAAPPGTAAEAGHAPPTGAPIDGEPADGPEARLGP